MKRAFYEQQVSSLCEKVVERIEKIHIKPFAGMTDELFLISDTYPGVWLEHVYDAVFYAILYPQKAQIAKNTIRLFINGQKEDGQLPCYVWDGAKVNCAPSDLIGYSQIQECVSFAKLCLKVYDLTKDTALLTDSYEACCKWVNWLTTNRMTTNRGLVEVFYGFDTGHDNSGRLNGLSCPGNYVIDGKGQNASVLPPNDSVVPVLAVDMNCNFYATLMALSKMAQHLNRTMEGITWNNRAKTVKKLIFQYCYNDTDTFFYDVDREGHQRKYLSSTIFHLFMEGVLDSEQDSELIEQIYKKHIKNPEEFWTEYPFPSMAANDPSTHNHQKRNCWGYFSQGLIALRLTMWMDAYGYSKDFDHICRKWLEAWTLHYDSLKFGQELDPHTGIPSPCSQWYSSCMLFYLYAARRLQLN